MDPHVRLSQRPRLPELAEGRYGRLFPELPGDAAGADDLLRYGAAAGPLESRDSGHGLGDDNPRIAAGWPFFGQLIAHDITHDRAPLQEREDLAALQNFRTPRLDLECLYGGGPTGQPYLYDRRDADKLLVGVSNSPVGDLPRNQQGVALVGDARNDTHLFISQLHLAFLHFHNRVVERVRTHGIKPDLVFERATQLVRWHYQWIVVHERGRCWSRAPRSVSSRVGRSFRSSSPMRRIALAMPKSGVPTTSMRSCKASRCSRTWWACAP